MDSLGFDSHQIDKLEFKTEEDKVDNMVDDSKDIPEIPIQSKVKLGDLFFLGEHRLLCGDSTNSEAVKRLMSSYNNKESKNNKDNENIENTKNSKNKNTKEENTNNKDTTTDNHKQADLVITDPPYNVAYDKSKEFNKILNDEMSKEDFYNFLLKVFKNYNDIVLKDGGAIYIFHSDSERINFTKSFIDAGLYFSQILIWVKNHFVLGRQDYQNKHEPILYGWKKGNTHYFIDNRTNSNVFEDEIDLTKLKKDELLKLLEELLKTDNTVNNRPGT